MKRVLERVDKENWRLEFHKIIHFTCMKNAENLKHNLMREMTKTFITFSNRFDFREVVLVFKMSLKIKLLERFDELIQTGHDLVWKWQEYESEWLSKKSRWQAACLYILEQTFGVKNIYYKKFQKSTGYQDMSQLDWGVEYMKGAREEIEKGFLHKIEHLVSADFFNSIIDQATHLLESGFKDAAAVYGRVIIENTLKDLAKRENIEILDKITLAELNRRLWKKDAYHKHVWRSIQAQVDIGNFAAHGEFDKYDDKAVGNMLAWIKETLLNL